jgi:hypothetical protein
MLRSPPFALRTDALPRSGFLFGFAVSDVRLMALAVLGIRAWGVPVQEWLAMQERSDLVFDEHLDLGVIHALEGRMLDRFGV